MALTRHPRQVKPATQFGPADTSQAKRPAPSTGARKALYRVPEAMRLLSLSRSVIYTLLRTGRLRSVKEGSTRLIPADAIEEYVSLLETEAEADQ